MLLFYYILARCIIPCMNNGKCIGINKCRCPNGFGGNHCEIGSVAENVGCKRPCRHGICLANRQCECYDGWFGRYCNQNEEKRKKIEHNSKRN